MCIAACRRPRPRVSLWTGLVLLIGALRLDAAGQPPAAELSRFLRTAIALQSASDDQRARFATEALGQLYSVYSAESGLARREAEERGGARKLLAWSGAVDRFAEQLLLVLEDVQQGFPVAIGTRRDRVVVVAAADRFVMLTHPRVGEQAAFEAQVLQAFCSRSDCAALTATDDPADDMPVLAGAIRPLWSFSADGPLCSHAGIAIRFSPGAALAPLRVACRRFFEELNDLLTEISWQQLHGAAVEWDQLSIRPTPGETEYFVRLNRAGDVALADLPLLHASPGLLRAALPWLSRRSAGEAQVSLLIDGALLEAVSVQATEQNPRDAAPGHSG
jgi:hypothetical protein